MSRRRNEFPLKVPRGLVGPPNGVWVFRSQYERNQATRLIENGIVFEYEEETVPYYEELKNGICFSCNSGAVGVQRQYTPDFFIPETQVFIETKGKFDSRGRTKMKNVCTQSEYDIRMVFMRDNWLTRKHKMNYSRWCDLNEVQYAIGDIPLSWCVK